MIITTIVLVLSLILFFAAAEAQRFTPETRLACLIFSVALLCARVSPAVLGAFTSGVLSYVMTAVVVLVIALVLFAGLLALAMVIRGGTG